MKHTFPVIGEEGGESNLRELLSTYALITSTYLFQTIPKSTALTFGREMHKIS